MLQQAHSAEFACVPSARTIAALAVEAPAAKLHSALTASTWRDGPRAGPIR